MHRILFVILILLCSPWRFAAAEGSVLIAAEDDWPPYSSLNKARTGPEGFAVDLVREVFKTQQIEVRFQVLPFARCLQHAATGKVMGCFDATRIESNQSTYCWHPTPLFEDSALIFGPADTPRKQLTVKDLEGTVVGSTIGYTYSDSFVKNTRIKHYGAVSDDHLIRMLIAGRVDYILLNGMPAYKRINADPALKGKLKEVGVLSVDKFWLAFTLKGDGPKYCELFEKGLQELHRNGKYQSMQSAFRKRMGL